MEIKVTQIPMEKPERVLIECHEMTAEVGEIIHFVKSRSGTLTGGLNERQYEIHVTDIFYIESVDNRTYIYTVKNVYDTRQKLYEIEEILADKAFLRISKSVVVNLMKIKALKPAMNGRFSAVLSNGEEVIISRKYVPSLKEKIRGGKG